MNGIGTTNWKILSKLFILLGLLVLSSCKTNTIEANSFCAMYYPVYYDSLLDSPETIDSININNALYEQCPF